MQKRESFLVTKNKCSHYTSLIVRSIIASFNGRLFTYRYVSWFMYRVALRKELLEKLKNTRILLSKTEDIILVLDMNFILKKINDVLRHHVS